MKEVCSIQLPRYPGNLDDETVIKLSSITSTRSALIERETRDSSYSGFHRLLITLN